MSKLIKSKVPSSLASTPDPDRSRQSQPCPQEGPLSLLILLRPRFRGSRPAHRRCAPG
jgi:hypothetical protein